jgi:hypothetical protein
MLTTSLKAEILQRTGVAVPPRPEAILPIDTVDTEAMLRWNHAVETLFVEYAAARAAKSLRDSEEHKQLCALRRMAEHSVSARLR